MKPDLTDKAELARLRKIHRDASSPAGARARAELRDVFSAALDLIERQQPIVAAAIEYYLATHMPMTVDWDEAYVRTKRIIAARQKLSEVTEQAARAAKEANKSQGPERCPDCGSEEDPELEYRIGNLLHFACGTITECGDVVKRGENCKQAARAAKEPSDV